MRPSLHPYCRALSLLGVFAIASPAAANDVDDAKVLFETGLADMEAGRYEQACKEFADSQHLDPHPGTLYTQATCESRWGHVKTAAARFGEYLALYETLTPAQQKRQGTRPTEAKEAQDRLTAEIPVLTLLLPPEAPSGTVVKRNGEVIATAALGVGRPLDPGEYVASTQAPGGPLWEQRIPLDKGEKKQVVLQVKAVPAVVVRPPEPHPGPSVQVPPPVVEATSGRRKAAYVAGGIGIAGLVLGGVMGGLTLEKKGIITQHCADRINSEGKIACDQVGLAAADSSKVLGLVSTIGFVAGLAGLGTGAVLLLTERKPVSPKTDASTGWISAGILSAGPTGALVGAHGAW